MPRECDPHGDLKSQLNTLKDLARHYDLQMNEDEDGYNPYNQRLHDLMLQLADVEGTAVRVWKSPEAEMAEWTLEVTRRRRVEWNNWVRSQGIQITQSSMARRIAQQGWSVVQLQRAIWRHGLQSETI